MKLIKSYDDRPDNISCSIQGCDKPIKLTEGVYYYDNGNKVAHISHLEEELEKLDSIS